MYFNINIEKYHSSNLINFNILSVENLLICDKENLSGINLLPNVDFIMVSSPEEMVQKIDYYLNHDEERINISSTVKLHVNDKYTFCSTLNIILRKHG